MRVVGIYVMLALSVAACGQSHGKKDDPQRVAPRPGGDKDPDGHDADGQGHVGTKLADTWFGMVTRCLVDAEEVKETYGDGSVAAVVKQTTACSPVLSEKDRAVLERKLDDWKASHCPARVEIRNGTPGHWGGCAVKAFGAQNAVSNSQSAIDAYAKDASYCGGKRGGNFGSVSC